MSSVCQIGHHNIHLRWTNKLEPVLSVASGSEVTFDLKDGANNQITPENAQNGMPEVDTSLIDPAFGPVAVEGAEPGDVLRVDILELTPAAYGWTGLFPNFGLLSDEFTESTVKIWDLTTIEKGYTEFKPGIKIPIRPFLGVMAVAPGAEGEFSTIPPYEFGGNIDCKHLTVGSSLYLPVQVAGALFSCGDGHAAQGDGEVCGTAIETPMKAKLRLTVEKNKPWVKSPHYLTAPDAVLSQTRGQEYAAMGVDPDLREAARKGVRSAIDWLVAEKGLSRVEAYMICSVAGDLKIVQAVDMPHYGVVCSVPLNIFVDTELS